MMATCKKQTLKQLIATREAAAGRKLTKDERLGVQLMPPQWLCSGAGVGGLRGTKVKSRRRRSARP